VTSATRPVKSNKAFTLINPLLKIRDTVL